jgi:hypothetical protein
MAGHFLSSITWILLVSLCIPSFVLSYIACSSSVPYKVSVVARDRFIGFTAAVTFPGYEQRIAFTSLTV